MFLRCLRGQVLAPGRPLALQMTVRHTGIYFSLKSASKLMQPICNAVNRGINVSVGGLIFGIVIS